MDWKLNKSSTGTIKKLLWVNAESAGFEKFNSLPVDYSKSLASTVFAREYFEEMLLNYMDELNALYVASTRAKDYLCIICPKTPNGKSDSKVPPNEIQVILSELFQSQETDEFNLIFEDNKYSFGEISAQSDENDQPDDHGQLIIHDYYVNEQLTERFKRNSTNEETWFNAKQRKGIVLHKILETLTGSGNLDKLIAEKVQEGLIREAESEEIRQAVSDVLMQHEIKEWFEKAKSIISEKDMIIDSGVVKRPDKLFILEDRTVLLDFKFGAQNNKYLADISLYRDNLIKMGEFEQVDAYIWYAQDSKLQKVSS
jgi:ATP-dependent exoDNAse (exonuclease V) beta subunit